MEERKLLRREILAGAGAVLAAAALEACSGGSGSRHPKASATTLTSSTTAAAPTTTISSSVPTSESGGPAVAVSHGPRNGNRVALTFHLGPHLDGQDPTLAHQLLDMAGQLQAPITVFAVGQWLSEHPDLVGSILGGGNELDNHTYTHPVLTELSAPAVASEITQCRDVLARLAPHEGRYFRPSGTSQATPLICAQAGAAGYPTVVDFDVDPLDYEDPGSDAVVRRVEAGVQPGSIVSMHFGHPGTIAALAPIVNNMRSRGLEPALVRNVLV